MSFNAWLMCLALERQAHNSGKKNPMLNGYWHSSLGVALER
jgi:hypothetical protein